MGYDGLDRLIAAVSPRPVGQRQLQPTTRWTTCAAPIKARASTATTTTHQQAPEHIKTPAGATVFSLGYDASGNTTSKNSQALVFDSANRLSQVTGQQTYRYDGQGRRVQTTDADGKTTFWMYSQSGQVLYTSEARRSQNLSYIYLGNTQVATRAWRGARARRRSATSTPMRWAVRWRRVQQRGAS